MQVQPLTDRTGMRSVAIARARVLQVEIPAVRYSRRRLERPVSRPATGASSLQVTFLLASALVTTGGGLQVVLVDTFARLSLALSFAFALALGLSGSAELLEHNPLIDLAGPEQSGPVCHQWQICLQAFSSAHRRVVSEGGGFRPAISGP